MPARPLAVAPELHLDRCSLTGGPPRNCRTGGLRRYGPRLFARRGHRGSGSCKVQAARPAEPPGSRFCGAVAASGEPGRSTGPPCAHHLPPAFRPTPIRALASPVTAPVRRDWIRVEITAPEGDPSIRIGTGLSSPPAPVLEGRSAARSLLTDGSRVSARDHVVGAGPVLGAGDRPASRIQEWIAEPLVG